MSSLPRRPGIYLIHCNANHFFYIGSTNNLYIRRSNHVTYLRRGTHYNIILQRTWNKYGEGSFEFYENGAGTPPALC